MFPERDFSPCHSVPGKCGTNAKPGEQKPQASFVANKDATHGKCRTGISDIIVEYGGWKGPRKKLFVVNGEFDPWRSASLPSRGTSECEHTPQEAKIIKGGHHCWDWNLQKGKCDRKFREVIDGGIQKVHGWLEEWYKHQLKGAEHPMPEEIVEFWPDVWDLNINSK